MGPNSIKRVDIQISLLNSITDHWEIKQKRNESEIESLPTFNELVMRDDFKSEIIKQ